MMKRFAFVCALFAVALAATINLGARQSAAGALNADMFKSFQFRSLGPPPTTGRVQDIAVDPNNPSVWYVASAAGGLWKTENRGQTFKSVFDNGGSFNLACVVVDRKDSKVVWLGTGENANPRSAMYGDGVYKSTDGGASWARVGLETSEHIGNIQIDPRNSNVVYVAAQGPLWSSGGDRGLYKTTDGGKTWKAILTSSPDTGANEVWIDPANPDILYATLYQRRRGVGQFVGGGPEGGIYKSLDAGAHWTKLTKGLPTNVGRIGLGIDGKVKPTRVYALIDALQPESGFYRSDDAGASWNRMGSPIGVEPAAPPAGAGGAGARGGGGGGGGRGGSADGVYRGEDPHYYYELFVDPIRPDTVWSEGLDVSRTDDGGKTFHAVPMPYDREVHVDYHAIVLDPLDRNHQIFGNDGGLYETWDDGKNLRHFDNLPITQFYRVAVDTALPFYHVCGGAQDNNSMCAPSRTVNAYGIRLNDWYLTGGGDGFTSRIDPQDPNTVYETYQEGAIGRLDLRTGVNTNIQTRLRAAMTALASGGAAPAEAPAAGARGGGGGGRGGGGDRINWDAPYIISPHSHTRLYWGGTHLWRSDDRGDNWVAISPDLTRQLDYTKIPIMGKVWDPATTVSYHRSTTALSTIVSLDESPLAEGLIYVGTDDGLLQVTEDGGKELAEDGKLSRRSSGHVRERRLRVAA